MKDILLITKILIKNSISINFKNKKAIFIYLLSYLIMIGYAAYFGYFITTILLGINMESAAPTLFLAVTLALLIFQNIISSINLLFFSKDGAHILPLPISSKKLLIAKINCLLLTEYISSAILLLPQLIAFGIVLKVGILYYIYALIVFILFPILPIALIVSIMSIIMRFTKIIRSRDISQYITIIVTLIIVFTTTGYSSKMEDEAYSEQVTADVVAASLVANKTSNVFPTIKPASDALNNYNNIEGLKNILILLAETISIYTIFIIISEKFFSNVLLNISSNGRRIKKSINNEKEFKVKSPIRSFISKEFKILRRNSVYFIQCILPSFVIPLIILIPLVIAINEGGEEAVELLKVFSSEFSPFSVAIRLIIIQTFYCFSYISITSISREGKDILFYKTIPIDYYKQIKYKSMPGIILGILPTIIIVLFDFYINKFINIDIDISLLLISILTNILINHLLIIVDLKHPKLIWTNEYAVVKQNINMIFNFVFVGISVLIILSISYIISNTYLYVIALLIIFGVLNYIIDIYLKKKGSKLFQKIEV